MGISGERSRQQQGLNILALCTQHREPCGDREAAKWHGEALTGCLCLAVSLTHLESVVICVLIVLKIRT